VPARLRRDCNGLGRLSAARWDGRQSKLYAQSSKNRALATQQSTRSGQLQLYDSTVFSFWLQATAEGKEPSRDDSSIASDRSSGLHSRLGFAPIRSPTRKPRRDRC
jgi:hypothetical protein